MNRALASLAALLGLLWMCSPRDGLMVSLALLALIGLGVLVAYRRRPAREDREVGRLYPLDRSNSSFDRFFGGSWVLPCLFLGRSGEYSFYLTPLGLRARRSLVGRRNCRRAFGLFR